ncbi:MAG: LLM class flavin-dependent oxidoreductase [Thermoprotei archaeon]
MKLIDISGLMLEPQEGLGIGDVVNVAKKAEEAGFPTLFRSDHLLPTSGRRGIPSAECWLSLGALASTTSKIRFGPLVSPIGFRHPTLLAKMAHDLHMYSGGRLIMGLGAGWYQNEFESYGIPFPPTPERIGRLEEALTIIRGLVDGERVTHHGNYYSCDLEFTPKPPTRLRIIVGARNKRTVRVAAAHADEWNFFATSIQNYTSLKKVFDGVRVDREVKISMMGPFVIAEDKATLNSRIAGYAKRRGMGGDAETITHRIREMGVIVGTPEEAVEQLKQWVDLGVGGFMFQFIDTSDTCAFSTLVNTLQQTV